MITLKTLEQATEQEIFDQVANHMLTQMRKSQQSDGSCAYRGLNGLKCAAGCLIADDEYTIEFENNTWLKLVQNKKVPSRHLALIDELQIHHDETDCRKWKDGLKGIAESFNLEWKF
jgi:hypothetical protein